MQINLILYQSSNKSFKTERLYELFLTSPVTDSPPLPADNLQGAREVVHVVTTRFHHLFRPDRRKLSQNWFVSPFWDKPFEASFHRNNLQTSCSYIIKRVNFPLQVRMLNQLMGIFAVYSENITHRCISTLQGKSGLTFNVKQMLYSSVAKLGFLL